MTKAGFYAVANGRTTGIFTTWAQAEAQVKGFADAKFKKFPDLAQAEAFLRQFGVEPPPPPSKATALTSPFHTTATVAVATSATSPTTRESISQKRYLYYEKEEEEERDREVHLQTNKRQRLQHQPQQQQHPKWFYVVAKGRQTGVFHSWQEVVPQIDGVDKPVYRKFDSQAKAQAFLSQYHAKHHQPQQQQQQQQQQRQRQRQQQQQGDVLPASGWFYVVGRGFQQGVFTTAEEMNQQIRDFPNPVFRKFKTRQEAQAFLDGFYQSTSCEMTPNVSSSSNRTTATAASVAAASSSTSGDPDPRDTNTLVAFCDGSAVHNGKANVKAGFACVFPHNPQWDVAAKLESTRLVKATNNRAEYCAALEAMKRANLEDPGAQQVLFIFSDSMLLIRSMTQWIMAWQRNNWIKSDGGRVQNRDLLEQLLNEKRGRKILWRHVKAHTGRRDWYSKWNDVADQRAREAALR